MFDPQQFLNEATVEGTLDTKMPLIPVNEYPAIIEKLDVREQPKRDDPSTVFYILDITYAIDDESARNATGLDKPTIRDSIFLDLDENGKLAGGTGKNIQLGRLRQALNINEGAFNFNMLPGKTCLLRVKHEPDRNDPETVWARVASIGSL